MQPRRFLWPRLETVFQVTKRGYSSSLCAGEACRERRGKEKKDVFEDDLEASPSAAFEDEVERDEGVEAVEPLAGDADA